MVISMILITGLLIYLICKVNKFIIKIILLIPAIILGLGFVLAFICANIPALNGGM